ncbi:hypothetical protein Tco_1262171 [Tanacetum coccineum]
MMKEWMARQMEANKRMKNEVVELENRINQGLWNRHAIIENLERQFTYLEKTQHSKSLPHDVLPNHVGDKEFKLIDGVGIGRMPKIKKDEMGMPKEPNKEWKLNEKEVPHNEEVYHYIWHLTKIPHLNRIIKES